MTKTGRNDPCPCGSGKKYKKCCLRPEDDIAPVGVYRLPFGAVTDTYPGDLILKDIYKKSKEFRNFYDSEKGKLPSRLFWLKANPAIATSLSYCIGQKGKFARLTTKGKTDYLLILDNIPPKVEDIVTIAHELMHCIVFDESYPGVGVANTKDIPYEYQRANAVIAAKLTSMLHDILVDSRLLNYGFDYNDLLKAKYLGHIRSYKGESEASLDRINTLLTLFEFVLANLQGKMILGEDKTYSNQYRDDFKEIFPNIAKEGDILIDMIELIGYDTPDKVKALLQEIMEKYGLVEGFVLEQEMIT